MARSFLVRSSMEKKKNERNVSSKYMKQKYRNKLGLMKTNIVVRCIVFKSVRFVTLRPKVKKTVKYNECSSSAKKTLNWKFGISLTSMMADGPKQKKEKQRNESKHTHTNTSLSTSQPPSATERAAAIKRRVFQEWHENYLCAFLFFAGVVCYVVDTVHCFMKFGACLPSMA